MFIAKILLLCTVCVLASGKPQEYGGFGAPQPVEGDDLVAAQRILQNSLDKLAAGEGPHYRISKILSASTQMVAGLKNIYTVELIDANGATKVCEVDIWSQFWEPNGILVTFKCPTEPVLIRNHSV